MRQIGGSRMAKSRSPLQVSDKFLNKLKELQKKIRMKTGTERSLRSLTDDLVTTPAFDEVEKKILNNDLKFDFTIKFDKRLLK
jgi:predicted TIM-barrel fold metal-dependent hydrolase